MDKTVLLTGLLGNCMLDVDKTDYFAKRGISEEMIDEFGLGYFGQRALNFLKEQDFETRAYISKEIFNSSKHAPRLYFGRPIIPIFDVFGDPIAFAARPGDNKSKYVNSHYSKKDNLFGLNVTKSEVWKTGEVYVTEGYFDCIKAYQYGMRNVCAVLSSSLGAKQVELLSRYAKKIWLVFDRDRGGEEGAQRSAELVRKRYRDVDLSIINLPEGVKDMDDYCEKYKTAELNISVPQKGIRVAVAKTKSKLKGFTDATVPDSRGTLRS